MPDLDVSLLLTQSIEMKKVHHITAQTASRFNNWCSISIFTGGSIGINCHKIKL